MKTGPSIEHYAQLLEQIKKTRPNAKGTIRALERIVKEGR